MEKFRGQIQLGFRYSEHLGPRYQSAGISIRFITHDTYNFEFLASWPEHNFSKAVEQGVLDGLRETGFDPDLGVHVVVENIEYDPVNSSEHAFYIAAKHVASFRSTVNARSI